LGKKRIKVEKQKGRVKPECFETYVDKVLEIGVNV
jgi:hypothetical protein